MGSLMASLRNAASAMSVFDQGIRVIQNNVTNMSTPGYSKQTLDLGAKPFDAAGGLSGGVTVLGTIDYRNEYAEQAVRKQLESYSYSDRRSQSLAEVEPIFDIADGSGVAGAMDNLFQAFSALTVSPNDMSARQTVLDRAKALASSVNITASKLSDAQTENGRNLSRTADQINALGAQISQLNQQIRMDSNAKTNSGVQAQLHNALEQLSQLTDYNVLYQSDGTASVYLGGQTALVLGTNQYSIQTDLSGPQVKILDSQGQDITDVFSKGAIGSYLSLANQTLPSYQQNLDRLASTLADTVNSTLQQGVDSSGATPTTDLFTYDPTNGAARTLAVNSLQPQDLAVALSSAPGGNGNALQLAAISDARTLDGYTLSGFYGTIAAGVGRDLATEQDNASTQNQLVLQAKDMRDQLSKVSPDEEAASLMEFQRSYEAAAQMVKTINDMTQTVINLLQ
jgi:flagellar hook-associated protein 1